NKTLPGGGFFILEKETDEMIIMKTDVTQEQIDFVIKEIARHGLRADVSTGDYKTIIGLVGDERKVQFAHFSALPGVKEAIPVETPFKLISREYTRYFRGPSEDKHIRIGSVTIGGKQPVFIAGPCAVESKTQMMKIAAGVKKAGAQVLRGGIFKPRSSVHSFQGLGSRDSKKAEEALKWLHDAGEEFDMPTVTEVRGESQVDLVAKYADVLQIGSRNMYDQDLLAAVGRTKKPVLFKRHFGASIEEFLSFAEYIAAEGNRNIILCERGILPVGKGKSFTRYTLDLGAVPAIKQETFLPIIVDPSHALGRADLIFNMSCASIAAGAAGLMIEVHYDPEKALVDGAQAIVPSELEKVIKACNNIHEMMHSRNKSEVKKARPKLNKQ
ncbi:MAG TPA: 3-deoxy-7-phosphoheptulonate synthase, partial [Dehalococcoidales bacterium]|nr:3-deoxy-7-phosphoheptulonate synthase [Dehalococcoidales bacterium]